MKEVQKKGFCGFLALYLVLALFLITLPAQGWAMFISSDADTSARQSDLKSIQKTLESAIIKKRLADFGLSSEEALARIDRLSDTQIHQFATNIDSLQAGGDAVDALIFVLVVAIIVIVVLEVSGHHIIVR